MAEGVTNNSSAAALKLCSRAATWKVFKNLSDGKRICRAYDLPRQNRWNRDGGSVFKKRRAPVVAVDASLDDRFREPAQCRSHSRGLGLGFADRSLWIRVG